MENRWQDVRQEKKERREGQKKGKSGKVKKKERNFSQKTDIFTGTVHSRVIYSRM